MKAPRILFLLFLLFVTPKVALADEANIGGTGSTVVVEDSEDIRMVDEVVNMRVHAGEGIYAIGDEKDAGYVEYDILYTFKNTSDNPVEVTMAFPEECGENYSTCIESTTFGNGGFTPEYKLREFIVTDETDGIVEIASEFRNDEDAATPQTNWYVSRIQFAPQEEKKIRNTYWSVPSSYKDGNRWFSYILETGASWKETIGRAEVNVYFVGDLSLYDVTHHVPESGPEFRPMTNRLHWVLEDFEPTEADNIQITYRDPVEPSFGCSVVASEGESDEVKGMASSYLPSESDLELDYFPCKAYDHHPKTAWVEGVEGDGVGEWIEVPLDSQKVYDSVLIQNGYGDDQDLWMKNNRVSILSYEFDNGVTGEIHLDDEMGEKKYDLLYDVPAPGSVRLTINGVYPGSKFDDTALTEIRFLGYMEKASIATDGDLSDVEGHRNAGAVSYVYRKGIVEGYEDGTYKPDALINRAEFTKILIEATQPDHPVGSDCFPDVKKEWFAPYVCTAKARGFIEGYPDGSFRPGVSISLVEAAKIIVNSFGLPVEESSETWFKPYIDVLGERTAIPTSINTFTHHISRGEMAEMIYRLKKLIPFDSFRTYNDLSA